MPTFDIFFHGQIMEGRDPASVQEEIKKLFKADDEKISRLFSGKPICIKAGVDQDTATRYRNAIRNAGALVEIRPAEQKQAEAVSPQESEPVTESKAPEEEGDMALLPPNTGSLIDCAQEVAPQPIPDTSSISLAPEGTTIDETEETPPAEIDTGDLALNPPQTGSLEDYAQPVKPAPIPDISKMELEQQEQASEKAVFAIDD